MATVTGDRSERAGAATRAGSRGTKDASRDPREVGWFAAVKASLDRPLTSYHLLLGVSGLLLALGVVMVASASSVVAYERTGDPYAIAKKQIVWVLLGLPMAWVASRLPIRVLRWISYPALLAALALLALTFVPGIGVEHNGSRNWLSFGGPFEIQPSEFAKLALVLWCADLLARKEKLLHRWKHLVIPLVPVAGLALALVLGEGDLGTSLILFAIVLVVLFVVGIPMRFFVAMIVASGGMVTWLALTEQYRTNRLTSFMDPFADFGNTGWQAAHSIYALGTGGWWGVGIGASRQKWGSLPEAHTDFIFAVIGEELGMAGTLVVLALFLTLAYAGIRIALRSRDTFVRLVASGIVGWLLCQALVNMGGVLAVLPITGVPLPLVSYGGSAMLPTLVAVGILLALAKNEPDARAALAARGPGRFRRAARRLRPGSTRTKGR